MQTKRKQQSLRALSNNVVIRGSLCQSCRVKCVIQSHVIIRPHSIGTAKLVIRSSSLELKERKMKEEKNKEEFQKKRIFVWDTYQSHQKVSKYLDMIVVARFISRTHKS